ncbi:MAG TPA: hypothetical protein VF170_13255, partial [Planctomycetaceae bacterium]
MERHAEPVPEGLDDLLGLALAEQAVVDEDAGELVADRLVDERCGRRRVDAADRFLKALEGVTDPEEKRKIIGREFIRVFEDEQRAIMADGPVDFLVQGTLYPDVVESGGGTGTANIKSHHN